MELKDHAPLMISMFSFVVSAYTLLVPVRNVIFDRVERALYAIDDKFIQHAQLRPYFYDSEELPQDIDQGGRQRCFAIAEFVLDVFGSILEQRHRFRWFADRRDFEQFMTDMFRHSPVLRSHPRSGYRASNERIRELTQLVSMTKQ